MNLSYANRSNRQILDSHIEIEIFSRKGVNLISDMERPDLDLHIEIEI